MFTKKGFFFLQIGLLLLISILSPGLSEAQDIDKGVATIHATPQAIEEVPPPEIVPEAKVEKLQPEDIPKEAEEPSPIERILSGQIPQTISKHLTQFGYEVFRGPATTFAPVEDVPVGPDYVIGPGDNLIIYMWGRVEDTFNLTVNRNGEVFIPKVGTLHVWGLTFSEAEKLIRNRISKVFSGFEMGITMGRLRSIQVFVMGEVLRPGGYTISSLSTLFHALFAAGGPTKRGSMRRIEFIRDNKKVGEIDLYRFLLKGDKTQDYRLQSGDVIFVPMIGPVAGIAGNVNRPAIYEMNGKMNLSELIDLAGGVTPIGWLHRVQVERIVAHEKRIVVDLDLSHQEGETKPEWKAPLQDGDIVKVFPILPTTQDIVYLKGHVERPGGYEFREGMRIKDLIPSFDELLPEPYLNYAEIIRLVPPDRHERIVHFNLGDVLTGEPEHNLALEPLDTVKIYSKWDIQDKPVVSIEGEVRKPGTFPLVKDMKIKDLVYCASGLKESTYLEKAELTRVVISQGKMESERILINLKKAMDGCEKHNILLQRYDSLKVKVIPEWKIGESVTITGEVLFPGTYMIRKGEMLSEVLERAGGFTKEAFLKGAIFTRESVKRTEEEKLEKFLQTQQEMLIKEEARLEEAALSEEEARLQREALEKKRELLKLYAVKKPMGRIIIKIDKIERLRGSRYDIVLEDRDTLFVPKVPSEVVVLGKVYNPGGVLYKEGKGIHYYLNKVGGVTEDADKGEIHIVRADGEVSTGLLRFRGIGPGDVIIVPEEFEQRVRWGKVTRDVITSIFQIATTAAVIDRLF